MFIVEYKDGSKYSWLDGYWASAPNKPIKKLVVLDEKFRTYELEGYDTYLYTREAISSSPKNTFDIAFYAGGFHEPSGDGFVLKVVLNDICTSGNTFGPVPSDCKDWYPINRRELGFAKNAYKTNHTGDRSS